MNKNHNIYKNRYWVAANITEYHIISRLIFLRIIIPKFMKIRQLFHTKNLCKNIKKLTCLKWGMYGIFCYNCRVASLSIHSTQLHQESSYRFWNRNDNYNMPSQKIKNVKDSYAWNGHTDIPLLIIELLRFSRGT